MKNRKIISTYIILIIGLLFNVWAQQSSRSQYARLDDKRLDHSRRFYEYNGFLRDDYIFSDNENRELVIDFFSPDTLVISNHSNKIGEDPYSIDMYIYHCSGHKSMVIDSVVYLRRNDTTVIGNHRSPTHPLQCKETVAPPGSDASNVNCANQAFYVLQPGDEILLSCNLDRLQIRDFTFINEIILIDDIFKLFDINKIAPVTPADTVTRRRPIVR